MQQRRNREKKHKLLLRFAEPPERPAIFSSESLQQQQQQHRSRPDYSREWRLCDDKHCVTAKWEKNLSWVGRKHFKCLIQFVNWMKYVYGNYGEYLDSHILSSFIRQPYASRTDKYVLPRQCVFSFIKRWCFVWCVCVCQCMVETGLFGILHWATASKKKIAGISEICVVSVVGREGENKSEGDRARLRNKRNIANKSIKWRWQRHFYSRESVA